MIRIEAGDCLTVIPQLVAEGVVVDSVVTDPPYHLTPTLKRFGAANSAPAQHGRDGAMARLSGGFMGQKWDSGDIAFRPETWATVATIMRPGAFLVAFGGTRTHHRLWSAIEDGGFVIQDTIMWLFASGFPKRRDMLKPAFEPIVLAYKPGGKRTMQVDECRIGSFVNNTPAGTDRYNQANYEQGYRPRPYRVARRNEESDESRIVYGKGLAGSKADGTTTQGRWPANLCHDNSDEVLAAFPESAGQQGDIRGTEPSPLTDAIYGKRERVPFNRRIGEASAERRYTDEGASDFAMLPGVRRNDRGSAARFFMSAKAGAEDRWGSRHPTVKPVDLIAWLVALVTPPGGTFLDPFAGSGTAAVAALKTGRNAILIERDPKYIEDIRARVAFYEGGGRHSVAAKARNATNKPGTLI